MKQLFMIMGLLAATFAASRGLSAAPVADFIDFSLRNASNQVLLPGRLYVPPEAAAQPDSPRPLMIFLHGSGANGTNNLAQLTHVVDQMLTEAKQRGAFLYAPQATSTWSSQLITGQVMTMVDRAISTLNADTNRVYLTGYSQGSHGTWTMLSRYDGRFAAAIPLSGGTVASDFMPSRLIDTPILTLHARDDATTSVTATRNILTNILRSAGESSPTYLAANNPATFFLSNATIPFHIEFRELVHQQENSIDFLLVNPKLDLIYYEPQLGGHSSLGAFSAPPLYEWMFAHTLVAPEPSSCVLMLIGAIVTATVPRRKYC
jgi:predicted esterase